MYRGALGVVLHFCRVAGVAPFQSGNENRVSSILVICAKLFITLTALDFFIFTASSPLSNQPHVSVLGLDTLKWISKLLVITAASVSVFTSAKRTLRLMTLLKELDKIDSKILGDSLQNINEMKLTILIMIYLHASLVIRFYGFLLNVQPLRRISHTSLHFMVLIAYYMVNLSEVQFVLFAKRTSSSLKLINDSLETIYKSLSSKDISHIYIIKSAWVNKVQFTNARSKPDKTISEKIQDLSKSIRQCVANYLQICNVITTSTEGDGFLIAILIISYILHLLSSTVELVLFVMTPGADSFELSSLAIYWLVMYSITLVAFVEPMNKTHLEMKRLQLLLTTLILKNQDKEHIKNELLLFWRIVNLNKPSYSPLGMFNLNRPLVLKIFGSLVTYLVIIVTYGPQSKNHEPTN